MNIIYFVIGLVGVFVLWSVWGYFSSRVETAEYSVIETKKDYEIRLYPKHIVAFTTVNGPYKEALNEGFRIVAGYIFGGNVKKESIAMTSPVIETDQVKEQNSAPSTTSSVAISMTSPVVAGIDGESHIVSFGMPKKYTLETLPTPTDPRVKIAVVPEMKKAVIKFSWYRTDSLIKAKKQALLDLLKKDGVTVIGSPEYAGYNAPWTPPWMLRNEVQVEVK